MPITGFYTEYFINEWADKNLLLRLFSKKTTYLMFNLS